VTKQVPNPGQVQWFAASLVGVWLYRRKCCLPDQVLTGCEVAGCAAKTNFSSSKLLREVTIALSSSCEREMTLQDFLLSLG